MAAHFHADAIKAWADGEEMEWSQNGGPWHNLEEPVHWPNEGEGFEFRIKPAEPERVYPETKMTAEDMANAIHHRSADVAACTKLANAALRHACDKGQIVTREEFNEFGKVQTDLLNELTLDNQRLQAEFDRAVGDREKRDEACVLATFQYINKWIDSAPHRLLTKGCSISTDPFHIVAALKEVK